MKKLIFTLLCLSLAGSSYAATIIVKADGSGDYPTIQAAIDDANEGDTVEVWPGIYTGNGNRDIDPNGKNLTIRSTNPNDPNIVAATIIDCNSTGIHDLHRGFYFHNGEDNNSVLDGLTITNGFAPMDLNIFLEDGGGILIVNSNPIIRNCIISNNVAEYFGAMGVHGGFGGGICCYDNCNTVITNCIFTSNTAHRGAGIACCSSSNPTISNCIVSSNSSFHGGGIFCENNSNPLIINCTVMENYTIDYGAGICCFNSNPTVLNCTISGNSAGDGAYGNGLG